MANFTLCGLEENKPNCPRELFSASSRYMGRGSWYIKNKKTAHTTFIFAALSSTNFSRHSRHLIFWELPFFREQEFWGHKFSSSLKCLISGFQAFVSVRGPLDSTKGTYTSGQGLGLGLDGGRGVFPRNRSAGSESSLWVLVTMNGADWTGLFRRQSSRMKNRAAGDTKVITHRKLLSGYRSTPREGFISIFSCRCHFLFFSIPGDRNETNLATKNNQSWQ